MTDNIYTWCAKASSYVKFKKDREEVYEQLVSEMEMYIKELKQNGMSGEEAVTKAILDKGNADEVGRALGKSHKLYIGWLWIISKWLMIASILFFLLTTLTDGSIYNAFKNYNTGTSSFIDEIYQNSKEDRSQIITLSTEQKAKFNGYRFSLQRAAKWLYDTGEMTVYFTIHTSYSFLKQQPDGIRYYMTAIDSNGNDYTNMLHQTGNRRVEGNPDNRTLTSCDYNMWIRNVDQDAEWIDLCYERFNHAFTFRIPLK